jgi:DNA-binding NarL/FixJ family response regulator
VSRNRILIIDDHEVVRNGIKSALELASFDVVGEANSCAQSFAQIAHKNPDGIVVDLNLPDGSGLEIVRWARSNSSDIGIVVLTLNESDQYLLASAKAGASAFILKTAPISELVQAVAHSLKAPGLFMARTTLNAMENESKKYGLTPRELEVLALLDSGESNADLASRLYVSSATLKTHLASIYRKLEVKNRVTAIKKARGSGLL